MCFQDRRPAPEILQSDEGQVIAGVKGAGDFKGNLGSFAGFPPYKLQRAGKTLALGV
jgi:hypothetical protein